ncbi:hypothetical protein K1T71_013820 [Dendrolimus kikuchii]|uniref:Uncharacterized protein n=1 Tax=Dendrolimus kikuchii TaxID=765133 RepID=A0ACC1CFW1_9NEOP|nr:hypothetical protein K1T71_013820 [Dendrolimus kikuchii]
MYEQVNEKICFQSTKSAPMSRDETMLLILLVAANKIINNKATNASNNKLKQQAWQTLTNEFNSSVTIYPRTPVQLHLKWENLKKSARKRCANMRSILHKTGGGKDYFLPDERLDKVASLLGSTCEGFSMEFGGDATTETNLHIVMGDVTTIGGETSGDEEKLSKEIQILETPSPKQNNWFLSKASGSVKQKHKMEEEKCKDRLSRENALAEYLVGKKKKLKKLGKDFIS